MAALRSVAQLLMLLVWRSQTGRDGLWHHSGLIALWFAAAISFPQWLVRLDLAQHRLGLGESLEAQTVLLMVCAAWVVFPFLSGRGRLQWRVLPGLRRLPLSTGQRFLISLWGLVFSPYLVVLAVYSVPVWFLFEATPNPAAGRFQAFALIGSAAAIGVVLADLCACAGRLPLKRAGRVVLILLPALVGVWMQRLGIERAVFEDLPRTVLLAAWDLGGQPRWSLPLLALTALFIPLLFLCMDRLAQDLGPTEASTSRGLRPPAWGGAFGAVLGLGLVQSMQTAEVVAAMVITLSYGTQAVQADTMPMETLFAAVSMLTFCCYPLLFSLFGFDRNGFQRYLLLPLEGRLLLQSKSAAVLLLAAPMGLAMVLLGALRQGVWTALTAVFMGMIQFLILAMAGHRISVAKLARRSFLVTGLDQIGGFPGLLTAVFATVPVFVGTVLLMRARPHWGPMMGCLGLVAAAWLYPWSLKRTSRFLTIHRQRMAVKLNPGL